METAHKTWNGMSSRTAFNPRPSNLLEPLWAVLAHGHWRCRIAGLPMPSPPCLGYWLLQIVLGLGWFRDAVGLRAEAFIPPPPHPSPPQSPQVPWHPCTSNPGKLIPAIRGGFTASSLPGFSNPHVCLRFAEPTSTAHGFRAHHAWKSSQDAKHRCKGTPRRMPSSTLVGSTPLGNRIATCLP